MKNINIYIITCDKTKHVLKVTLPLMEKYWNIEKHVKILGFNGEGIDLPKNYEFISMKPVQAAISDWARDIHSVIQNDPNEHVIFMLDDMPPLDYIDVDILNLLFNRCRNDKEIVRCALCIDLQFLPCFVIENFGDHSIVEQSQHSDYRITTQPSIWRKDYLLSILAKSNDPWHFETAHPSKDGKRIIGTRGKYACCCMGETVLSGRYPNKFNILGLKLSDVKWLVGLGALDELTLQFGQYLGSVPQFSNYGYDFKLEVLKNYSGKDGQSPYNYYLIKYGHNYKKTLNNYFSKIYCINLDKRVDRWEECLIEFKKLNIVVERISAIDGKDVFKPGLNWSAGAYGLLLTVIKILENAIINKYDSILILEDDAMFNDQFYEIFDERIISLPNDWDLLYLGGNNLFHRGTFNSISGNKNFEINEKNYKNLNYELCKTTWTQCAHALAINSKFFNIILKAINENLTQPIDVTYCQLQSNYKAYTFLPSLVRQRAGFSDIENKSVDYNSFTF